jgi:hypothetical protein
MQWIPDPNRTYVALRDLAAAAPATTDPELLAFVREVLDTWDEAREDDEPRPDLATALTGVLPMAELHGVPRVEYVALVGWLDTAIHGLGALLTGSLHLDKRRDPETLATIAAALAALEQCLAPRLEGLSAALVRAHYAAGGNHPELAAAMGVPKSTAQSRAAKVLMRRPSEWEDWATGDVEAAEHRAGDLRPGWKIRDGGLSGRWLSVEEVRIYGDGLVEASIAGAAGVRGYGDDELVETKVRDSPFDEIRGTMQTDAGLPLSVVTYARPRAVSLEDR